MHSDIFTDVLGQTVLDKDMIIRLVVEQLMDLQNHLVALSRKLQLLQTIMIWSFGV
jgi:hypothetical protein